MPHQSRFSALVKQILISAFINTLFVIKNIEALNQTEYNKTNADEQVINKYR